MPPSWLVDDDSGTPSVSNLTVVVGVVMNQALTERDELELLAFDHDWGISISTEPCATVFDRGTLGTAESGPIVGIEFESTGRFKEMFFTYDMQSGRGFGSTDIQLARNILTYEGD